MITTQGKETIRRYLVGQENQFAGSIQIGVGSTAATVNDRFLEFFVAEQNIEIAGVTNDFIVFKTTFPATLSGNFYEVGLCFAQTESVLGEYPSRLLSVADPEIEIWTGGTWVTANTRVSGNGVAVSPSNGTAVARLQGFNADLSGYSDYDTFSLAANFAGSVNSLVLRFGTSETDYYDVPVSVPSAGYRIVRFSKNQMTKVGAGDLTNLNYMEVRVSSTTTGTVTFDALRVDDNDTPNENNFLVARRVIAPFSKVPGTPLEAEMAINVGFA